MPETQATVSDWADHAFGTASSNMRIATRVNEEMAELLRALSVDDNNPQAAEEIADVVIILYRLARNLGTDLQTEIDRKMTINRKRIWKRDATGHGYHVRNKTEFE